MHSIEIFDIPAISKQSTTKEEPILDKPEIDKDFYWSKTDIESIKPKYAKLIANSHLLLKMAKQKEKIDSILQILVVIFGIISSFVMNISSISDISKTYLISIFTLGTTLIGGVNSIKKFGQNSGKYYSAYQEYKELTTYINNLFVRLKADQTYEQLNNQITKKESKYEIMLPQNKYIDAHAIDCAVNEEYKKACEHIENNILLEQKQKKLKEDMAKQELYKTVAEKKSYIFLQEIRLKLYREYVMKTKIEAKESGNETISILDLDSYENYFRTNRIKTYYTIVDRYKTHIDQQLAPYILSRNGNEIIYDYGYIERELINDLLLRYDNNLFYSIISNRVREYEKEIMETDYTSDDEHSKKVFVFNQFTTLK